jgi:hypothetical protein
MGTRSDREYTMVSHAQILRNWSEQRPSNNGDLDWSVTGDGRVYHTSMDLLLITFFYRNMWLMFGCVLNGAHCTSRKEILLTRLLVGVLRIYCKSTFMAKKTDNIYMLYYFIMVNKR